MTSPTRFRGGLQHFDDEARRRHGKLRRAMGWVADAWPLMVVALAVSSLGFHRLVYFVSLGYAFSMVGMAALTLWRHHAGLELHVGAHVVLLGTYGARLGAFLVARERAPSYRKELVEIQRRGAGIGPVKRVAIWVGVSLLYVLMFSPALFNVHALAAGALQPALVLGGGALMVFGLGLEAAADAQKSAFKRAHPDRFCDVGLYRVVRCPNYLGEVIFWVGSFLAGASAYASWSHWVAAATGLVCIVLIMMGSTKRLEHQQDARYQALPEYQRFIRRVPVLFPFVPLYSLKNVRVYLE